MGRCEDKRDRQKINSAKHPWLLLLRRSYRQISTSASTPDSISRTGGGHLSLKQSTHV